MKTAREVRSRGLNLGGRKRDMPVNVALGQLTTLEGSGLELTTRTTPRLVHAAAFAYIYTHTYNSDYARGRIEQIERLAVSMNGQGRRDLIDVVQAGGSMPDNYLEGASQEFMIHDSDDGVQ